MTSVNLIPHPDKSPLQWMNLPTFLVLCSPYLIPATSLSSNSQPSSVRLAQPCTNFSGVLLKCSCKNQSQEAPAPPYHWPSEQKKSRKKKIRSIGQRDTDPTSRHYSSGMGSIFATEGDFPKPCCVLRSAVRLTCRDYCHLHHNHVVGLVLRTKTSTHSREKGGGRRGEGAREHTKEPMQTNKQSPPHW